MMAMEPEMIRTLSEFDVPSLVFNTLSNAGFTTADSLLNSNDMLLRSYGIKKEIREKILSWIHAHKCVFNISLFSSDFQVGKPIPFKSNIEFCRWEKHINRVIGQAEHFELIEVLMLLKEANQNVREMTRQLNIPMKKLKILIRHTPIPIGGDLEGFPSEETWLDQLPGYTGDIRSEPPNPMMRAHARPPTPDLSNSTVTSSASSVGSSSLTVADKGFENEPSIQQKQVKNSSANTSVNGSLAGSQKDEGGNLSKSRGSGDGDSSQRTSKSKVRANVAPQAPWPVAKYGFRTSSRSAASLARDRQTISMRPSTSPSVFNGALTCTNRSTTPQSTSLLGSLADYNHPTYASVRANEAMSRLPTKQLGSRNAITSSSLVTVVVKKPPKIMTNDAKLSQPPMFDSQARELTPSPTKKATKTTKPSAMILNESEIDWQQSATYSITRNSLGTTFSPISSSDKRDLATKGEYFGSSPTSLRDKRASKITQQLLGLSDSGDHTLNSLHTIQNNTLIRPRTVSEGFRARAPLRDPSTTFRSGGRLAAGNGRLSHTAASKYRPVFW